MSTMSQRLWSQTVPPFVTVFLLVASQLGNAALAAPTLTRLDPLPGGATSSVYGVNDGGSVVLVQSDPTGGQPRGAIWTAESGYLDPGVIPGGTATFMNSISGDGHFVVGRSVGPGGSRAVRWSQQGGLLDLGLLDGAVNAEAVGVSGDGSTVVGFTTSALGHNRAFKWDTEGSMIDLGVLEGDISAQAYHVTRDGTTVFGLSVLPNGAGARLFRWTEATGMVDASEIGEGNLPYAMSADGSVWAGLYLNTNNEFHAYRWSAASGMQDLGVIPGSGLPFSQALGISGDGSTVVGLDGTAGAFLWNAELGMVALRDYLPTQGVDLQGWDLTSASSASFDGSTIAGTGYYNGVLRGWVVTGIPAPGGALTLAAGLILYSPRRRR